jgi:hypothetical protein
MVIEFERSGGFAGLRLAVTIRSDTLPEAEANELRDLVDAADFFNLPAEMADPGQAADQYSYVVTVESGGQRHTVKTSEAAAPANLKPLLDWLGRAARRAQRGGGS